MTPIVDESSPTSRALLTLEAIQGVPGITADRLAERLQVSDRAARRYVAMLREAGIPVESTSGRYGGYRIGRGARIPPLMFSTPEALGLVMAVLQGWHGSIDQDHPAAAALAKIVRVLPAAAAQPVTALRGVRAQNPGDAAAMPDPERTVGIARACGEHATVRIDYRVGSRAPTPMVVDPWAVVVRHGRWYLLCRSHRADAPRVLRLDRIIAVDPTGASFEPPELPDPIEQVEAHLADGWQHTVEVRINAGFDDVAWYVPRILGRLESEGDGCVLRGSTDEPEWYASHLTAIPAPFTVTGSAEVRAAVRAIAERFAAALD